MIIQADTTRGIPLADESVQCVCTSPPYWGLRDYSACECSTVRFKHPPGTIFGSEHGQAPVGSKTPDPNCKHCEGTGKVRGMDAQLGLEKTPEEYVSKLVAVFREVRRVLRKDGTVWLNLGDSYAGGNKNRGSGGKGQTSTKQLTNRGGYFDSPTDGFVPDGLKPKDLVGVPWRVAFALQADGWWLRQDIIWHKPNPMPESVTDRCTKAHEYVFLLAKSGRYWYDGDAISEKSIRAGDTNGGCYGGVAPAWNVGGGIRPDTIIKEFRNRRSVWTIATQPYPEAHFATFPEALVEPCILAGCPVGGIVLDPFVGSGTTIRVANRLQREAIGIDLKLDYLNLATKRIINNQVEFIYEEPSCTTTTSSQADLISS